MTKSLQSMPNVNQQDCFLFPLPLEVQSHMTSWSTHLLFFFKGNVKEETSSTNFTDRGETEVNSMPSYILPSSPPYFRMPFHHLNLYPPPSLSNPSIFNLSSNGDRGGDNPSSTNIGNTIHAVARERRGGKKGKRSPSGIKTKWRAATSLMTLGPLPLSSSPLPTWGFEGKTKEVQGKGTRASPNLKEGSSWDWREPRAERWLEHKNKSPGKNKKQVQKSPNFLYDW